MELVSYLEGMRAEGQSAKDLTDLRDMDEHLGLTRGQQWPRETPRRTAQFILNLLNDHAQRKTGLLTDARPVLAVTSTNPAYQSRADMLTKVEESLWTETTWQESLAKGIGLTMIAGSNVGMMSWDPLADYGRGDIRPSFFDPRNVTIDPSISRATHLEQAEYITTEEVRALAALIEQFGERAEYAQADAPMAGQQDLRRRQTAGVRGVVSAATGLLRRRFQQPATSAIPRAIVRHYWFKDWPRDAEGRPSRYVQIHRQDGTTASRPRRREIRHVVVAGRTVLVDEPNPYWHRQYPIEVLDWGLETDHLWGQSEIRQLRGAQEALNRLASQILRNTNLMNNFIVKGDHNALDADGWNELTNRPAILLRQRPNTRLEFEAPPALPAYLFNLMEFLVKSIEMVGGLSEVAKGVGHASQSGISIECADPETECLTMQGWKHYWDLQPDDLLYTLNTTTGQGEWSPLLKLNVQERYQGEMVRIKGQCLDALVTPNHAWMVDDGHVAGRYLRVETQQLGQHHRIPLGAPIGKADGSAVYRDAYVEFVGWLVTEGCYSNYSSWHKGKKGQKDWQGQRICIRQSCKANPAKCEAIEACLQQCGFAYHVVHDAKNHMMTWWIGLTDSRRICTAFPDKRPGYTFIQTLSQRQCRLLMHTMLLGDGNSEGLEKTDGHINIHYTGSDQELLNQFQMIACLAGFGTTKGARPAAARHHFQRHQGRHRSERYTDPAYVNCTTYKTVTMKKRGGKDKRTTVDYDGPIWCPTTETGTFLARRNGVTYFTSNSLQTASQTVIRFQARRIEAFLTRLFTKSIALIFQFYTENRVRQIVGPGGDLITFLFDRGALVMGIRHIEVAFRDFLLGVHPMSSLNATRVQKAVLMGNLYGMGLVGGIDVLEAAEIANPQETLAKAKAEQAEAATVQAMAQGLGAGGPPGGGGNLNRVAGRGAARAGGSFPAAPMGGG